MSPFSHPFALIDVERMQAFAAIPELRRRLVETGSAVPIDGVVWRYAQIGETLVGISELGPGSVWDGTEAEITARTERLGRKTDAEQQKRILRRIKGLRLGPLTERLAWKLHAEALEQKTSVLFIRNDDLARCLWDRDDRPKHWRKVIRDCLCALSWLHLADHDGDAPSFGYTGALISAYGDVRGGAGEDGGAQKRSGFHVELGPGFLGVLEQCGMTQRDGSRRYQFLTLGRKHKDPGSLRKLGRTGRLTQAFIYAMLGDRGACDRFSPSQHRLLKAIVRETTYQPRGSSTSPRSMAVYKQNGVTDFNGKGTFLVNGLDDEAAYVGFNGNGVRRGQGYKLNSEGGWLAKAGYVPRRETLLFLNDLQTLSDELGLEWFAVGRRNRTLGPAQLRKFALAEQWSKIEACHLRIYAPDTFEKDWSQYFCGVIVDEQAAIPVRDVVGEVRAALRASEHSARSLATELEVDSSYFSKILRGQKPLSTSLARRLTKWLRQRPLIDVRNVDVVCDDDGDLGDGLFELAARYLRRGWSVIPQIPRTKRPYIKWKRFRERIPTLDEWREWSKRWPNAGLMLILGSVSKVIVVDVDGKEAYDAMLQRVGKIPDAPKAFSGSGDPFKFHLFFRHPDGIETKAKFTPWHPKLEFRGTGGALVLPPSLHPSGRRYRWENDARILRGELPPLIGPILQTLRTHEKPSVSTNARTLEGPKRYDVKTLDVAESTKRVLSGEHAYEHGWNDRLFKAACDLKSRGVPFDKAKSLLLAGARPRTKSDAKQVAATTESAYSQDRAPSRR